MFSLGLILAACQTTTRQSEAPIPTPEPPGSNAVTRNPPRAIAPDMVVEEVEYADLWARIRDGFQLQADYARPEVQERISDYAGNQRYFDLVGERAAPFLYFIVEQLEQNDLPLELALVPIVESTFNPNAYSAEHAVGLWQFLSTTGRSFGLQQDWWYDGRRDPRASTVAALQYLDSMHEQFQQDWLLALAAYNTGSPNLRRAIRRSKQPEDALDFWTLPLAPETRAHIPKLLALASIIQDPATYGIELPELGNAEPLVRIDVDAQIDLAQAARLADMDEETLRFLNAGYRQWATHPDAPQWLYLPKDRAEEFKAGLSALGPEQLVTWDRYEIKSGDTLGGIASKLGTGVDVLRVVNNISGSRIIAGRSLLVPRGLNNGTDVTRLARLAPVQSQPPAIPDYYTVRRGDNLWSIARRYQLKSAAIAANNGFSTDALLQPGQVLDLRFAAAGDRLTASNETPSPSAWYRVRPGDSMARIATRLGLELDELLLWNDFSGDETIYPEQRIRVRSPESYTD